MAFPEAVGTVHEGMGVTKSSRSAYAFDDPAATNALSIRSAASRSTALVRISRFPPLTRRANTDSRWETALDPLRASIGAACSFSATAANASGSDAAPTVERYL